MSLLHAHAHEGGILQEVFVEVVWHALLDALLLLPFLFLTYLLMEYIEHKASDKLNGFMRGAGAFGPLLGGPLGAIPQCGFSAAASNLFACRVISCGTLVAIFLSTSDEMLPILISGGIKGANIALILLYKCLVGIFVGFCIDIALRLMNKKRADINIDAICDEEGCHCEKGILHSAVHHTVKISLFVFCVTLLINGLVHFVGVEALYAVLYDKPVLSHAVAAAVGLVPNCASSVALTEFFAEGMITAGTMISGLFSGAGVGLLVLFKVNKDIKENLFILLALFVSGITFGLIFDLIFAGLLA